MSKETFKAFEKALAAHMEDERPGAYISAFGVVLEYTTVSHEQEKLVPLWMMTKEDQTWTHSRGLFESAADEFKYGGARPE